MTSRETPRAYSNYITQAVCTPHQPALIALRFVSGKIPFFPGGREDVDGKRMPNEFVAENRVSVTTKTVHETFPPSGSTSS